MCTYMQAPHSYTGEDVVEFSCHGSPAVLRRALELLLKQGARLAQPGEFTLRAFLNGKLDLAQSEAVMDVVRARTGTGLTFALDQLEGRLSHQVQQLRQQVLALLARLEANIDFSEDDVPAVPAHEVETAFGELLSGLGRLLETAQSGAMVRDGVPAVLVGRPNVGKSSLLNAFLAADRAIVTDIPGTTRDVLEETIDVDGIPLVLADTAGIADSEDVVEQIGVERSRATMAAARLIIVVLDGSMPLQTEDHRVLAEVARIRKADPGQRAIIAVNKSDKAPVLHAQKTEGMLEDCAIVPTSAVASDGIQELRAAIGQTLLQGGLPIDSVVVTSLRHQTILREAQSALTEARGAAAERLPEDFICIGLRAALNALGELTGESATEDLLDRIFGEFCLGK
jgi:tRNA modification GTPase